MVRWSRPLRLSFHRLATKIPLKTCHGANRAARERVERRPFILFDVVAISCITEMIAALVQRSAGDVEEMSKIRVSSPPESFSDIRGG